MFLCGCSNTATTQNDATSTSTFVLENTSMVPANFFNDNEEDLSYDSEGFGISEYYKVYNSFDDFIPESDIVIQCEVINTKNVVKEYGGPDNCSPYTVYEVNVDEAFLGNINKGDKLVFVEYGGILTSRQFGDVQKDFIEEKIDLDKKLKITDGVDLVKKGDILFLFAKYMDYPFLPEIPAYYTTFGFQGRFTLNVSGNEFIRKSPGTDNIIKEISIKKEDIKENIAKALKK